MRVAVAGAGAIGGFIAAMLARAGTPVAVVARGAHLQAIRSGGLRVRSECGDFTAALPASDDLRELGDFDAVLIAVKAHQIAGLLPQLLPQIAAGATIVPVINGLPFWYFAERSLQRVDPGGVLRAAIPREQIVGCVIHASGNLPEPGLVHQSGGMNYILGDPDGAPSTRADAVGEVLRAAGLDAPVVPDIKRAVWWKLLGNVSLNPVSALTRLTIKPMLDDPQTRAIVRQLMEETVRVAAATGIALDVDVEERIVFASRLANVKTSMLQDVEAARPLELDPITGAVDELAQALGVDAPAVHLVYGLAKALERSYVVA